MGVFVKLELRNSEGRIAATTLRSLMEKAGVEVWGCPEAQFSKLFLGGVGGVGECDLCSRSSVHLLAAQMISAVSPWVNVSP